MAKRRIPDSKSEFNDYQRDSTSHLEAGTPARGITLGLTTGELDDWKDYRDEWVLLYPTYTDTSKRTKTITQNVNDHMTNFRTFAEPLLNRISVSTALNNEDRTILNLPERDKTPTRKGKIEDTPLVGIKGIGGGQVKFRIRGNEDSTRASMHPMADFIEIKYSIAKEEPEETPPTEPGSDLPTVDTAKHYAISKKALFVIETGTGNTGKFIVAFVRWANASNPSLCGPWSLPIIGVIL